MASPIPPPQAIVDLVTHIQGETSHLCSHFFNFTGSLQRDAPPVSLSGEPLAASRQPANSSETLSHVPSMAEQIVSACKRIDALIEQLPDLVGGEEEQLQRIVTLQERNEDAGARLRAELAAAGAQLEQTQALYAALADDKLQHPEQ